MGKISKRPMIIHRERITLLNGEKAEKFPEGPMVERPGPTLLTQVRAAEKEMSNGTLSSETTRAAVRIIRI